jgi:hypothetical protein
MLYVKPKTDNISIIHFICLAFEPKLPLLSGGMQAAGSDKIIE